MFKAQSLSSMTLYVIGGYRNNKCKEIQSGKNVNVIVFNKMLAVLETIPELNSEGKQGFLRGRGGEQRHFRHETGTDCASDNDFSDSKATCDSF